MIALLLIIFLDVLFKLLFNKLIFLGVSFSLIYFLNNNKNFYLSYVIFSFLNDLILLLPIGFTGFYLGIILILITIINKFISFDEEINSYVVLVISLLIFFIFIWYYYLGFNFNFLFFKFLIINLIILMILNFIIKNF
ncbi:MAG: hypothetical protein KatS3mg094_404 [Candidatus Parcubacteria bacterium]|nr:MAG: hypothetical protein KatS3mg094_404 [Candidatus Parcubacteria bacterium]